MLPFLIFAYSILREGITNPKGKKKKCWQKKKSAANILSLTQVLLKTFSNCHFHVVLFLFPSHLTEKQQQISILTNANKTVPTPVLLKILPML